VGRRSGILRANVPGKRPTAPPPEAKRIRLGKIRSLCLSPQYVAEQFLDAEGFSGVEYVETPGGVPGARELGEGKWDIGMNSVATKRALRAILKGDVVCAVDPGRAARAFGVQGYATDPALVLQAIKEIPFGRWREYDPGDTLRFYALRLHEAGMVKSSPQKILAQGTDWRFLTELRKELKG
jgi:hypothetical protein